MIPAKAKFEEAIHYFRNELDCIDVVAAMRWPQGPVCAYCGAGSLFWLDTQRRWKCRTCRKQFSVKMGTIFEDSAIPLQKWLPTLWLLVNCKDSVSSCDLASALKISQKSAGLMMHRLRLALDAAD